MTTIRSSRERSGRCSPESRRARKLFACVDYHSLPRAVDDLRAGFVQGVLQVPQNFSQHYYQHDRPRIAFTEDNTDQVMASALLERVQQMVYRYERARASSHGSIPKCS